MVSVRMFYTDYGLPRRVISLFLSRIFLCFVSDAYGFLLQTYDYLMVQQKSQMITSNA